MTNLNGESIRYPLLQALLELKGLRLQGIYKVRDIAKIFDVGKRTIQECFRDGRLTARDLPGRGRCLSEDLEQFLVDSIKGGDGHESVVPPANPATRVGAKKPRIHRKAT